MTDICIINECLCKHRNKQKKPIAELVVGDKEINFMSFTINPGQTKTLTVIFTDTNLNPPLVEPLGQVPTAVDKILRLL